MSEHSVTQSPGLKAWHDYTLTGDPEELKALLTEDCTFHSPVVHNPQAGRDKVFAYLRSAHLVLGGEKFEYVREFDCGDSAVLEFRTELDGIMINGIDMIQWDQHGKITDFKVMVRPLQAIQKVHGLMGEMLAKRAAQGAKAG